MSKGPARDYSWPPFEKGNTAAATHGAGSDKSVVPLAAELVDRLVVVAPWCAKDAFAAEVEAWSRAEARVRLIEDYVDKVGGPLDGHGEPLPCTGLLLTSERVAARSRDALGLNPAAWAKLAAVADRVDHVEVLDELRQVGRAALEAREAS